MQPENMQKIIEKVGFVHLHVHTSFSLREGALTIPKLIDFAKADAMPALAITDTNNLFGALEFSEKLYKEGIQPIIGCHLTVDFGDARNLGGRADDPRAGRGSIVVLARDAEGYANLMRIVSAAWIDPSAGDLPHVQLEKLAAQAQGLIALSGGPTGAIDGLIGDGRAEHAGQRIAELERIFDGRFYVELQRHGTPMEKRVEPVLLDFAFRRSLPLVATNEPYFAALSDHEAHDALLCIADGSTTSQAGRRQLTADHRFKTRAEMRGLFSDLPEALNHSVEIALRCNYRPTTRGPILPRFTTEAGEQRDEVEELQRQAREGLAARLAVHGMADGLGENDHQERLGLGPSVIIKMKFPGYFLIVADFIKWAKAHDIPVGPGRGSGAGSLVAWSLTITDLDPMRFGLLFERFLNPERVSMPDFDIDFCQYRRDEVIRYVRERYGVDRVAQIITFGSFLARGVMRNVGRVLEMPLGQVDKLAKLVPQNPAAPVSLKQAIESEPRLLEAMEQDERVATMLDIAQKLEGLYSNASTHAAGIVIGDRPLVELVPALSRSEIGYAGDPVQHEMGRAGGPGQIRLPRPQDADDLGDHRRIAAQTRRRGRYRKIAARRQEDLRNAGTRRNGRRVPGGKRWHAQSLDGNACRPAGRHHRAGRALSPRPDGQHPDLLRREARRTGSRLYPSQDRADLEGDVRRHHLPRAGDADRADSVGLFARRSRYAAPRHG